MPRAAKYTAESPFRIYELAKTGMSDAKVAKAIGIDPATLVDWKAKHEAVRVAFSMARKAGSAKNGAENFKDYVYKRLSPELKPIWDEVVKLEFDDSSSGYERVSALLKGLGVRARQHLWIHALIHSNFNASEACRLVDVERQTLDDWTSTDPDFLALVDEIHWHKGNFFEGHFVNLVASGDTAATIFAQKTFNRDRGYNEKQEIEINQTVNVRGGIQLEELPLEIRVQILEWYKSQEQLGPPNPNKMLGEPKRVKVLASKVSNDSGE